MTICSSTFLYKSKPRFYVLKMFSTFLQICTKADVLKKNFTIIIFSKSMFVVPADCAKPPVVIQPVVIKLFRYPNQQGNDRNPFKGLQVADFLG